MLLKRLVKNIIKFIVDSNIWIALATVSFYELSLLQVGETVVLNATVVFLFLSALFTYNLFKHLGDSQKKTWLNKNSFVQNTIRVLIFLALLSCFFYMKRSTALLLGLSGVLTFFYATPFFKIGRIDFNLRKFWFLKSIVVALVWTISTSIVPLVEYNLDLRLLSLLSVEKFLFILGITIPYDIKDLKADNLQMGMTSLAMKFGLKKTIIISNLILSIGLLLALYLFSNNVLAICLSYISAILLNTSLDETKGEYWYTFLIDATIILYFLLYFFFTI